MSAASSLQLLEVAELVQAQDAQLPKTVVVDVAFVEHDFAADDLVARGGVAREIDAADEELLAFVRGQRQIDLVRVGDEVEVRLGDEIDIAEFAVELAQVLEALAQFLGGEEVALAHTEQRAHQRFGRAEEFHAHEVDLVQAVQVAFVDWQR